MHRLPVLHIRPHIPTYLPLSAHAQGWPIEFGLGSPATEQHRARSAAASGARPWQREPLGSGRLRGILREQLSWPGGPPWWCRDLAEAQLVAWTSSTPAQRLWPPQPSGERFPAAGTVLPDPPAPGLQAGVYMSQGFRDRFLRVQHGHGGAQWLLFRWCENAAALGGSALVGAVIRNLSGDP